VSSTLLRRYFITGLVVLIPVVLTLYIVGLGFRWVHSLIGKHLEQFIESTLHWNLPGVGVVLALLIVLVVGFLGSTVIGKKLFGYGEALFYRIPLARTVYPAARQVVDFLFGAKDTPFRKVVMVEYGLPQTYVIGFVTGESPAPVQDQCGNRMVNVFVPFTPTPATGLTLLVHDDKVIPVDLSVEQAIRLVVSGGVVVYPPENGQGGYNGLTVVNGRDEPPTSRPRRTDSG